MYSNMYISALKTYKKSELYQRELALNCVSSIIPFSSRSKYYKQGIRGIEEYKDGIYTKTNLYVDISYLFSNVYNDYVSSLQLFTISHGNHSDIIADRFKFYVISNDFGIESGEIYSKPNLYFNIDISSFDYIISDICLGRDNLFNLCSCNPNIVIKNTNNSIFATLYSVKGMTLNVDEDVSLLMNLMKIFSGSTLNLFIPAIYEIRIKHIVQVFEKIPVTSMLFNFNSLSYGSIVNNLRVNFPSDFNIEQFNYNKNPLYIEYFKDKNDIKVIGKDDCDKWYIEV